MSFRLSLNEEVAAALNEQICIESSAAFLYFSMASWASVRGLTGMAKWFRTEAAGELTHMGLFVDYLNDRDYQAKFSTIEAPASDLCHVLMPESDRCFYDLLLEHVARLE